MSNKVICAFGNISDRYLEEALQVLEGERGKNVKVWKIVACLALVIGLLSGMAWGPLWGRIQMPAKYYEVGDVLAAGTLELEYVDCTDGAVHIRVKNLRDREYEFVASFRFTNSRIDPEKQHIYTAATGYVGSADQILSDVLVITVDGMAAGNIQIPADGKFHDVVIDFSAALEQGYQRQGKSWDFDGLCLHYE